MTSDDILMDLSWSLAEKMVCESLASGNSQITSLFSEGTDPEPYQFLNFDGREMWRKSVTGDVETTLYVTLRVYLEALEKSPQLAPAPLRKLTEGEKAIIMCRYGMEYGPRLEALHEILMGYTGTIPSIGTLQNGILTPIHPELPSETSITGGTRTISEAALLKSLREKAQTPEQVVDCLIHLGLLERI